LVLLGVALGFGLLDMEAESYQASMVVEVNKVGMVCVRVVLLVEANMDREV
jgi:hypothetical protein